MRRHKRRQGREAQGALAAVEEDEAEALGALASRGLVEVLHDEDGAIARISWRGVEALRDAGIRR